jgi:hypothetical protein
MFFVKSFFSCIILMMHGVFAIARGGTPGRDLLFLLPASRRAV